MSRSAIERRPAVEIEVASCPTSPLEKLSPRLTGADLRGSRAE
jgi:hypothetical protein